LAKGCKQTFNDLCRELVEAERGLFSFALWMFCDKQPPESSGRKNGHKKKKTDIK
jgi:hypothetical protein